MNSITVKYLISLAFYHIHFQKTVSIKLLDYKFHPNLQFFICFEDFHDAKWLFVNYSFPPLPKFIISKM